MTTSVVKFIGALALILVFCGCSTHQDSPSAWSIYVTDLAVSRPGYEADYLKLEKALRSKGLHVRSGEIMLGAVHLWVDSRQFTQAKSLAIIIIAQNSLTVAIQKDPDPNIQILEEYERGRKVGETDYSIKDH